MAYEKHCRGLHESLAPVGTMETDLAQSIADDRWRLKRSVAIESCTFALGLAQPDEVTAGHPEIDGALAQARVWRSEGKSLHLLGLHEHGFQRRVEKNMNLLRELQQERKAALRQAAEEVAILVELAASKGETYDPERDFPRETLPPQFDFSNAAMRRLAAHQGRLAEAKRQHLAASKPLVQTA